MNPGSKDQSREIRTTYGHHGFGVVDGAGGVRPMVLNLSNHTVVVSNIDGVVPGRWSEPVFASIYTRLGWFEGDEPIMEIGGYTAQSMLAKVPWIPALQELGAYDRF